MTELADRARMLWFDAGGFNAGGDFTAYVHDDRLVMMATVPQVGRKNTMTVRCVKMLPLVQAEQLAATIATLLQETKIAMARSNVIGVRF